MNRFCPACGDDNRMADEPVNCGHDGETYCSPLHSRVGCVGCYDEHHAD